MKSKYVHYYFSQNRERRIYCGMVTALDAALGRIVNTLEETKMMNNTLIVFTTDNGGNVLSGGNNYPLRGGKVLDLTYNLSHLITHCFIFHENTLWEGGTRGPAFIHGPMLSSSGTVSKVFVGFKFNVRFQSF